MPLAEIQKLLALIYTHPDQRERFFENPFEFGKAMGLSEADVQSVLDASREEIKYYADSLHWKRFHEAFPSMPMVQKLVEDRAQDYFKEFVNQCPPPLGIHKPMEDAQRLADFLLLKLSQVVLSQNHAFLMEVIRYEKTWLQARELGTYFKILLCRHSVGELREQIMREGIRGHYPEKPTWYLWRRRRAAGKLKFKALPMHSFEYYSMRHRYQSYLVKSKNRKTASQQF